MKRFAILVATVAMVLSSAVAQANPLIGVNFFGRNDGFNGLNPTDTAGVLAQQNWNNTPTQNPGNTDTYSSLVTSTGAATSVTLTASYPDDWTSGSGHNSPNNTLLSGIVKATGTPVTLTWNGAAPGGDYDVYVYFSENGTGSYGQITAGSTTYYLTEPDGATETGPVTFTQGTNTTNLGASDPLANYVEFKDLTPNSLGQILLTVTHDGGSDGFGIAAIQLQAVPEPSTLVALLGLAGIGLIVFIRRRRKAV
jgi:hypothetical protein